MLSVAKVPLFFWAEAIATTCFTQNRSLIIPRRDKTPYHIINGKKPSAKFFHIFGSLCYILRDGENLDEMKEKGDACIFVRYSTMSRGYRVYNKITRLIVETIHVNFDELPLMVSDHVSSNPAPQCQTMALEHDSLITSVVSKSSAVHTTDSSNKHHQLNTTPSTSTTVAAYTTYLDIRTTPELSTQTSPVDEDEFINIFSTSVYEVGETSSRHVDPSNMDTFYQRHPSEHHYTRDHPVE
ncbi:retrovirus-related pol polyprotein from transposon TNT 1-94 [Tanacetum coccineum]